MTEINADNLPGRVMAPAAAYLTDKYTNRDIFGVVRGKCSQVSMHIIDSGAIGEMLGDDCHR